MKISKYLQCDMWHKRLHKFSLRHACRTRMLRILVIVAQGFKKKQLQQGASALTYYSMLAIIPILTLLFAMAKGFLLQDAFQQWLSTRLAGQEEVISFISALAKNTLLQSDKGLLLLSLALAIWAGIKMLIYIELSMNQTWEVYVGRPFAKRFSDYLALLCLCPLVVLFSSGLTLIVSTAITEFGQKAHLASDLGIIVYTLLNAAPILINWFFFTFLYIFIPNTYVKFFPAFYAGILTGTMYQVMLWCYFYFQVAVSHYNVMYGTLAAVPLFLIWAHLSWMVILVGSKMTFAFQNVAAYDVIDVDKEISHRCLLLLSLRLTHLCVQDFCALHPPSSPNTISQKLRLSLPLVNLLLARLVKAGVLAEVVRETESGFQPALPLEQMSIKSVIDLIDTQGENIEIFKEKNLSALEASLKEFASLMEGSHHNLLLKDF